MLRLLALLVVAPLVITPAAAQTPILLALRAQDWTLATALAAGEADALAPRLVTFIRLLNPGQASADELAAFMQANPAWPDRAVLEHRYGEALALEPDPVRAAGLCRSHPPLDAAARLHCAIAYSQTNAPDDAQRLARLAWTSGLTTPSQEAAFAAAWPTLPTQADQRTRYELLEKTDAAAAARQLARLDPPTRLLDTARLALRQNDPDALAALAAVPADLRGNPALLLAEARFLRRSHADQAALALWRTVLPAAEAATPEALRSAFWTERDALARRLLAGDEAQGAVLLANDTALAPEQSVEAHFLAGWITLRRLHDPAGATAQFTALLAVSHAAITQARALYWLARAAPDPAAAQALYQRAAAWPLTYYGQLAARAAGMDAAGLHARIEAQQDPAPSPAEQAAFAAGEAARAATILAGWQDKRRAADFLGQSIQPPASPGTRALAAALALRLGLPDIAVQAARLAGRDGLVLPRAGWPQPVTPPQGAAPASLALAIMRQESSFDPATTSPAGAHGLMQLMPATAAQLGRTLHAPAGPLSDPDINMRLGTAYLASLLARFDGCTPCAIAAYNAGPHRAQDWLAGAAPAPGDATVDWIEMIPFAETRNYVQRVLENQTVYEARS